MNTIYEVVDYTDDERYYPLAVFKTLEQAKHEIESAESNEHPISEFVDNGYERIVIIARPIGWSGNGNHVFEIERKEQYNEQEDEYYWERING